ncbi:MAG: glucokinase [Candidatus Polarisedimenticolia bacterium]
MILAGDVGATKTRIALYDAAARARREGHAAAGSSLRRIAEATYPSATHPGLSPILSAFGRAHPGKVSAACIGVAGPVRDGRCTTTNLPWVVDAHDVARDLGLPSAILLNDLEAGAWGLGDVAPEALAPLHAGAPDARGNAALVSPGTGLGEAGLYWDGRRHRPFATEGGHASFAPADDLQAALWRHLAARHGAVSWERVLSGPGLVSLYGFLRDTRRGEEPDWLREALAAGDPAAAITDAALAGRSELCSGALDLFVALLGAEAGNFALKVMATGGVFLGGGIVPKILPRLKTPILLEAFFAKGRMRPLLESMPVRAVLDDRTVLLGAARRAIEDGSLDYLR